MSKHQEIAARLEGPLTAAECGQLLLDVHAALLKLDVQIGPLHPGDSRHNRGEERKRALLSGKAEDLLNLRDRFDLLQAEIDQLNAQRDELQRRRTAARVQEAFASMPATHAKLQETITAAEEAHRAFEAALDQVEAAYLAVDGARGQCRSGGMTPMDSDRETIGRLMQLAPFSARNRVSMQQDAGRHRENLGCDLSAGREAA